LVLSQLRTAFIDNKHSCYYTEFGQLTLFCVSATHGIQFSKNRHQNQQHDIRE